MKILRIISRIVFAIKRIGIKRSYMLLFAGASEPPQISVVKTNYGIFSGFSNDYLFQCAIRSGSNEQHFVDIAKLLVGPNDVCLDVGANIGTHSLILSSIAHTGSVISFEPQSVVYSILQNNIILNKRNNISTYRFAISNENYQTIRMEPFSFSGASINNGGIRVDHDGYGGGDLALTRKLDSFDFQQVDFIKFDIQGSEVAAIKGSTELISRCRPFIFLEIEEKHLNALGASTKELIEEIIGLNYILYRINTDYPCDHICIPKEKETEFEKAVLVKIPYRMSPKIIGPKVEVIFKNKNDQNYECLNSY
jgi:FkbM family methyltransferase